jgi:UDP-N-acetylmuramoylalanine--D-glutamate ligase
MDLEGRKVAVVGLGKSGVAAAELCQRRGALVSAYDAKPQDELTPAAQSLREVGIDIVSGELCGDWLSAADFVVISPGVDARNIVNRFDHAPERLISELDLAARFVAAPIALIGGTNGKSTVTAWAHDMLSKSGQHVFAGGNFGTPLCDAVDTSFDSLVVEISSFQAEHVPSLRPRVHALLNISEDHLDRYDSFADYADAKGNPFVNMLPEDLAVLPAGDDACAAQAARGRARRVTFSAGSLSADVSSEGSEIVDRIRHQRFPTHTLRMGGRHNLANACAAIAVAAELGATPEAITSSLSSFEGLAHRHVLVAHIDGVNFYDDSKATNVGAAVAALRGLDEPRAVLIAGGRDKFGAFEPLVEALRDRGRALVTIGEAAGRLSEAVGDVVPVVHASSMRDAVDQAAAIAQAGEAVLLSPACSSFDMFDSFAQRGEAFAQAVRKRGGQT